MTSPPLAAAQTPNALVSKPVVWAARVSELRPSGGGPGEQSVLGAPERELPFRAQGEIHEHL